MDLRFKLLTNPQALAAALTAGQNSTCGKQVAWVDSYKAWPVPFQDNAFLYFPPPLPRWEGALLLYISLCIKGSGWWWCYVIITYYIHFVENLSNFWRIFTKQSIQVNTPTTFPLRILSCSTRDPSSALHAGVQRLNGRTFSPWPLAWVHCSGRHEKSKREWEGERQGVQLRITGCAYWSHFHNLPSETLLILGNMLAESLVKIPGQPLPRTPLNLVYLIIPCHEIEVT